MCCAHKKSVLIIDDDEYIHDLFKFGLAEDYGFHFAFSANEALRLVEGREFPVVTLDLMLAGKSGLEILPELLRKSAAQKVIILTGHACKQSAMSALNLGVFRYMEKPFSLEKMRGAIDDGFAQYFHERQSETSRQSTAAELVGLGLTFREAEIAHGVTQGETNLEIASRLGVSPRTVEKYLEAVFTKLKITSRMKLASRARHLRARL
ncbi:MAG: response regulator transcription factor [Verrucomicrobiae bacterium]